ncbi:MAG: UDPGP type 1 family protein [Firmicutes bacterium]|nr:UDPGP type 1 family protein [Bacillota bacterium]
MDKMKEQALFDRMKAEGQEQILRFWTDLSDEQKESLARQIDGIDFQMIRVSMQQKNLALESVITPLHTVTTEEQKDEEERDRRIGEEIIRQGKVAALVLAGGQGSRLGYDGPKGTLKVGITKDIYLFGILISNMVSNMEKALSQRPLHFLVMTSDQNHEATLRFFEEKAYFGYPKEYIHFFRQDMAPALSHEGKILMEDKDRISLAPNGNGGWFSSMQRCGLLDLLKKDGVEWINVFSVDNILQNIADPVFLGAASSRGVYAGAKVIAKVNPDERVGAICYRNGRPSVVEYSELTEEMRNAKDQDGQYLYNFGVTLNYIFHLKETEKAAKSSLPIHRANKKIACIDEKGDHVQPAEPNAFKLEYFIFDILEAFDEVLSLECIREDEFAPIKNKEGVDSLETARALLVKKTGRPL